LFIIKISFIHNNLFLSYIKNKLFVYDILKKQLTQETYTLPKLILNNNSFDDIKYEDIQIIDYKSSPTIKFPLSN